jgi:hypothetical protein
VTIYEEVIAELKALRTLTAHLTRLGKLSTVATDTQLKVLLGHAISFLQVAHMSPGARGKTTPGGIEKLSSQQVRQLRTYCEGHMGASKPDWQVEAERNGWSADWQAEARRQGWSPPGRF